MPLARAGRRIANGRIVWMKAGTWPQSSRSVMGNCKTQAAAYHASTCNGIHCATRPAFVSISSLGVCKSHDDVASEMHTMLSAAMRIWNMQYATRFDIAEGTVQVAEEAIQRHAGDSSANWLDRGTEHPHRIALSVHVGSLQDCLSHLRHGFQQRAVQVPDCLCCAC